MRAIAERVKDCQVRFLLTHPAFAHLRQRLEGIQRLEEFHIAQEIFQSVVELRQAGVPYQNIRFVKATPTVFGVMTSKLMLLNPYPYQGQAFGSVTFLFDARNSENAVYRAFNNWHFQGVWDGANVAKLGSYELDEVVQLFEETLETLHLAKSERKVHFAGWQDNSEAVTLSSATHLGAR
jgi:hypothetical protein